MGAKTAEESEAETSLLSRRIFASPPPRKLAGPIAGVSLLTAILLTLPAPAGTDLAVAFAAVALPVYGSAVGTLALGKVGPGRAYLRRTTLQAFVDACLILAVVAVAALASALAWAARGAPLDYSRPRLLLFGFAATTWLRQIVWTATYDHRPGRAFALAGVTPFLGALAVALAFPGLRAADVLLWAAFLLVFLGAALTFVWAVNRPIRHAFGVNGVRLMRHLLDQMTGSSEESRREMEAFFDSIAQPAEVRTGALALRGPHGTLALLVATHAHPGPFARVGGSDLPAKLRAALGDVCPFVVVPHGPSTHDSNPSTTAECLRLAGTVREILDAAKPVRGGSVFARATVGKATATAQFFGDVALVTASLAPDPTDDIDTPTGHAAIRAAKDAGARDCLFLDAHNSAELGEGTVRFGSAESLAVIEATHAAVLAARRRPAASLRVGTSEAPLGDARSGFGAQGLQVLVVEADGQRSAYLVFDGNNMVRGLRDAILASVREVVQDGEVLTTDNHSVNATMGGYNPIGLTGDPARILEASRRLVEAAVADLRPVESVAGSGVTHGLRVFGHENTARLTSSVNATITVLRPIAALTVGIALAVSAALLALVP